MKKKTTALLLVLVLAARLFGAAAAANVKNWYFVSKKDGSRPELPALDSSLGTGIGKEELTLYLTFDAGYENGHTAPILDALAKHKAPAAFFVVGTYIEQNPELVKRMAAEGHIVGNHTWHHWDMDKIGDRGTFEKELADTAAAYEEAVGAEMPRYYRPPRGVYAERNLEMAKALGYQTVFWSLAYVDWKQDEQPSREEAFDKLLSRVHNGAVVLLHSTSATNAEILDELLTKWEEMGYRFASLDELFAKE